MKIVIKESQLISNTNNLKNLDYKLPKFLFDDLKIHRTSLSDNPCFPSEQKYPFDYMLIKDRFKIIKQTLLDSGLYSDNLEDIENTCNKLIQHCIELETPIRDLLNNLCKKVVKKILYVPEETVIFNCHLVDRINCEKSPRILPEDDTEKTYTFDDVNDIENSNKTILKRRFINSLIQGASYSLSKCYDEYEDEIYKIESELPKMYRQIQILTDYLLFMKKDEIDEKHLNQGAYVEVNLGRGDTKTSIKSQALIFPYLLTESIRGFFELFASHGLPKDNEKAMYLIRHADFLMAESWDLRFGVSLWEQISNNIEDKIIVPYFFSELCQLPTDIFNVEIKEILSNTKHGKNFKHDLIQRCKREISFNDLPKDCSDENIKSVISDNKMDNFTIEELNEFEL